MVVGVYRYPKLAGSKDMASEEELRAAVDDCGSEYLQEEDTEPPLPPPDKPPTSEVPLVEPEHLLDEALDSQEASDLNEYSPSEYAPLEPMSNAEEGEVPDDEAAEPGSQHDRDSEANMFDRIAAEMSSELKTEVLLFAAPVFSNKSLEVLAAIQEFTLWLKSYNLPVRRAHTDKSKEFLTKHTRSWLLQNGIMPTYSVPGVPQSNGTAEAGVKLLKSHARTLIASSGLPVTLWPQATVTAAALQRAKQLGMNYAALAPLGTKVLAREPRFHQERAEMNSQWSEWQYAGLSRTTVGAHVLTRQVEGKQKFLHTKSVRLPEAEPEDVFPALIAEPAPERRVRGEQPPPNLHTAQVLDKASLEVRAQEILSTWCPVRARKLATEWALGDGGRELKFGMFRQGGMRGRFKDTDLLPHFAKLLSRLLLQYEPDATFTSLVLGVTPQLPHFDSQNDPFSSNVVLPLKMPLKGGHHWTELRRGDVVTSGIQALTDAKGSTYYGSVSRLQALVPSWLDPRRRHGVTEWHGDRVVLVGYTINALGRDISEHVAWLEGLGYNVPEHLKVVHATESYHEETPQIRMVSLQSDFAQKLESVSGDAPPLPSEARSPTHPVACGSSLAGSPRPGGEPVVKEGGWSERVKTGAGEVEFTVQWGLKVGSHVERGGEPEGSKVVLSSERQRVEGHAERGESPASSMHMPGRRRKQPPGGSKSLPSLPLGWTLQQSQTQDSGSLQAHAGSKESDFHSEPEAQGFVALEGEGLLVQLKDGPEVNLVSVSAEAEPQVRKVEPSYIQNPEEVLASLTEPLQVVHNVSPKDVAQYPERWLPAIEKELRTIQVAIQRLMPGNEQYREAVSDPAAVKIPAKLVFTLKPPNQGAKKGESLGSPRTNPDGFFRRKVRIVGCGNYSPRTGLEVYASGSAPEAFRILLTESAYRQWLLGTLDIVAAFLETPIPSGFPPILVTPPGLLRRLSLAAEHEVWRLVRALYELRESPRLWSSHRDRLLQSLRITLEDGEAYLCQTEAEQNLWRVLQVSPGEDSPDVCIAYVLIYVDGILIAASLKVLRAVEYLRAVHLGARRAYKVFRVGCVLRRGRV